MKKKLLVALTLAAVVLAGCGTATDSNATEETKTSETILPNTEETEEPKERSDEDVYNEFKSGMVEIVKELEFSDEMTGIMRSYFEGSFNSVNSMNSFSENELYKNEFSNFVQAISYFELNYDEGTVGNDIGTMGWDSIYSLMMNDGNFKSKMSDLKKYYETNISTIYETKYESGQYKVGVDIPSGEYVVFSDSGSGYFAITSDSNGDDIIANENFNYNSIIAVNDGEYFELSRCSAVPIEEVNTLPIDSADMFKVGVHIPAGEYKLLADSEGGYYCIYNDNRQDDIEANDNFDGQSYVSVSEGQYLLLSRCHIEQ